MTSCTHTHMHAHISVIYISSHSDKLNPLCIDNTITYTYVSFCRAGCEPGPASVLFTYVCITGSGLRNNNRMKKQ